MEKYPKDHKEGKDIKDFKDFKDFKDIKDFKEWKDLKEMKEKEDKGSQGGERQDDEPLWWKGQGEFDWDKMTWGKGMLKLEKGEIGGKKIVEEVPLYNDKDNDKEEIVSDE